MQAGWQERDLSFVREALGLEPEGREFHLTYGLVPDGPNQIVVITSSMLEIMVDLAWRVDVPREQMAMNLAASRGWAVAKSNPLVLR